MERPRTRPPRRPLCHYCGARRGTRPYGPAGEPVCFTCATSPAHIAETEAAVRRLLADDCVLVVQAEDDLD